MKQEQLIKLAMELTEENYCYGFDHFVECYDTTEWNEFLELYQVTTEAELITALNESAESHGDEGGNQDAWTDCEKCIPEHKRGAPKFECDCDVEPFVTERIYWVFSKRINPFIPIPNHNEVI